MSKITINEILNKIKDIPPLPENVTHILRITRDPDSSAKHLTDIIEKDQALTTKILKMANSSYYGFPRKISTISHAIMCLGFNTIKSLALTAATKKMFDNEIPSYSLEKGMLWQHSLYCATCCKLIANKTKYKNPEESYIAGLIHDIGKSILDEHASAQFQEILKKVKTENISFNIAEQQIIGFDHAEIGSRIAEKWNLPSDLVEAIRWHHQPQNATANKHLTYIVHLANSLCSALGVGIGSDGLQYTFQPETLDILHVSEHDCETLINDLTEIKMDIEGSKNT